jgi:hypothetical protein
MATFFLIAVIVMLALGVVSYASGKRGSRRGSFRAVAAAGRHQV